MSINTFTPFKIFLWFFSLVGRPIKKYKDLNFHLGGFSIACTSVLILSVWIGIQEHEQNLESEYGAGPVNVYKCMSSAGSDYIQYESKPEHKTNLGTSGTGTFSCSELYFSNLPYLLLQISSLWAELPAKSRLWVTALGDIPTEYRSSWYLCKCCVKSSHSLIFAEEATIYRSLQSLAKQAEVLGWSVCVHHVFQVQ